MSDEYPLDEETKLKFHDILTKLSNDDPNFFKIFSKTELKTLESVLSEEVCVSFVYQQLKFLPCQIIQNLVARNRELEEKQYESRSDAADSEHGSDYSNDETTTTITTSTTVERESSTLHRKFLPQSIMQENRYAKIKFKSYKRY